MRPAVVFRVAGMLPPPAKPFPACWGRIRRCLRVHPGVVPIVVPISQPCFDGRQLAADLSAGSSGHAVFAETLDSTSPGCLPRQPCTQHSADRSGSNSQPKRSGLKVSLSLLRLIEVGGIYIYISTC
jgi:hypothetical protein